ncbi:SDR family oxidoreductase [Alicyclobacillus shizuokensis]|uniref:SDR family oxidoreductase n=1 Tax=Alicyclobacillus shizuokensis TaxID=392014 RepID=UPI00082C0E2A|nr:SDR family oxidoreductase [Alicyclobacillus shizuokensis]
MNRLQDRIAIVTGVSRRKGIGTAICKALASEGANIFFTDWVPFDETQEYGGDESFPGLFEKELSKLGVKSSQLSINLADRDAYERLLDAVEDSLGTPAILVNNAAHCQEVSYREMTSEILDMHYPVNVRSTCMLSTHFVQRYGTFGGRIIKLVSGQEKTPTPGNIAYETTKGAISIFTQCLAREVASLGVTVNAVDPGPTDSGWMTDEIRDLLLPKFPMGRIGTPEDVAKLIAFLASDDAQWITGQIIHSDGGFWD